MAINPTPAASPSTPSIKLNALITTIYVKTDNITPAHSGISLTPNNPCKLVNRTSAINTIINATNKCAANFFTGAVPMMSSFIPTKNIINTDGIRYLITPISLMGSHNKKENNVPPKIIIPPIKGTRCLCNFLSPVGSSNRCFNFAIFINDGVEINTIMKEVNMGRINSFIIYKLKIVI